MAYAAFRVARPIDMESAKYRVNPGLETAYYAANYHPLNKYGCFQPWEYKLLPTCLSSCHESITSTTLEDAAKFTKTKEVERDILNGLDQNDTRLKGDEAVERAKAASRRYNESISDDRDFYDDGDEDWPLPPLPGHLCTNRQIQSTKSKEWSEEDVDVEIKDENNVEIGKDTTVFIELYVSSVEGDQSGFTEHDSRHPDSDAEVLHEIEKPSDRYTSPTSSISSLHVNANATTPTSPQSLANSTEISKHQETTEALETSSKDLDGYFMYDTLNCQNSGTNNGEGSSKEPPLDLFSFLYSHQYSAENEMFPENTNTFRFNASIAPYVPRSVPDDYVVVDAHTLDEDSDASTITNPYVPEEEPTEELMSSAKGKNKAPAYNENHRDCYDSKCDADHCAAFRVDYRAADASQSESALLRRTLDKLPAGDMILQLPDITGYLREIRFDELRELYNVYCRPEDSLLDHSVFYVEPLEFAFQYNYMIDPEEKKQTDTTSDHPDYPGPSTAQIESAMFQLSWRVWRGLQSPRVHPEIRSWARHLFRKQYKPCYKKPKLEYAERQADMTDTEDEEAYKVARGGATKRRRLRHTGRPTPPSEPKAVSEERVANLKHQDKDCKICKTPRTAKHYKVGKEAREMKYWA